MDINTVVLAISIIGGILAIITSFWQILKNFKSSIRESISIEFQAFKDVVSGKITTMCTDIKDNKDNIEKVREIISDVENELTEVKTEVENLNKTVDKHENRLDFIDKKLSEVERSISR
jgi:septal ring factor EnvC (AmiA/AmiB activator)